MEGNIGSVGFHISEDLDILTGDVHEICVLREEDKKVPELGAGEIANPWCRKFVV